MFGLPAGVFRHGAFDADVDEDSLAIALTLRMLARKPVLRAFICADRARKLRPGI
jgi:hypothetical protein